jgi:hypothetical protein
VKCIFGQQYNNEKVAGLKKEFVFMHATHPWLVIRLATFFFTKNEMI